jgi:anti-sigma-K factor RskA
MGAAVSAGALRCDDFEALAPEIALGTLSGTERADAVAHLASCADCQRRVTELADAVDAMMLLAPEDEPSSRLEAGVLAQTVADGTSSQRHDRGRRWWLLAGIAAAAVVVVVTAMLLTDGGRDEELRTALAVTDGGASVCRAIINEVDPAWLFVSLEGPADEAGEEYLVELQLDDGDAVRVGRLEMRDGRGALAVTVDLDGSTARAVRLIGGADEAQYEATFS